MYQLSDSNIILLLVMFLWVLPWKGYALWTASKKNHKVWFVVFLIVNTFAILEIIYVFWVAKKTWADIKRTLFNIVSLPKKKKE